MSLIACNNSNIYRQELSNRRQYSAVKTFHYPKIKITNMNRDKGKFAPEKIVD